jgi:hypothetical protein
MDRRSKALSPHLAVAADKPDAAVGCHHYLH